MKTKDLKIFIFIWAGIFIIFGLFKNIILLYFIGGLFAIIGLLKPTFLMGFYKLWIKIGEFIGGIMAKVIMFILYFGLFTPISIVLKILRKDLLNKKIDKNKSSYWIDRETQPQSMKNQF